MDLIQFTYLGQCCVVNAEQPKHEQWVVLTPDLSDKHADLTKRWGRNRNNHHRTMYSAFTTTKW